MQRASTSAAHRMIIHALGRNDPQCASKPTTSSGASASGKTEHEAVKNLQGRADSEVRNTEPAGAADSPQWKLTESLTNNERYAKCLLPLCNVCGNTYMMHTIHVISCCQTCARSVGFNTTFTVYLQLVLYQLTKLAGIMGTS